VPTSVWISGLHTSTIGSGMLLYYKSVNLPGRHQRKIIYKLIFRALSHAWRLRIAIRGNLR